jgi:rRNA maturation endonuclease Nob1
MSEVRRRCLGCTATYPADEHACPKCGSHAADVEKVEKDTTATKPPRRRRT